MAALARDNYSCTRCGSQLNLVVHHIDKSRRLGKDRVNDDLKNLTTLCRHCHQAAHEHDPHRVIKTIPRRFTDEVMLDVLALLQSGLSYGSVGVQYGVSRQRIWQAVQSYKKRSSIPSKY